MSDTTEDPIVPEDFRGENVQPVSQLRKYLPPGRNGRPLDLSTLQRWRLKGLYSPVHQKRVLLPAFRLGGTWYSSVEKLRWFLEIMEEGAEPGATPEPPRPATRRQINARQRYVEELCRQKGL